MSDVDPALAEFIAGLGKAWGSGDVDAIAEAMGLPHMLAHGDGTEFIEDDAALTRWIDERLAAWAEVGVTGATTEVERVEDLPDDAARVTVRWRLAGADKTFTAVDTLVLDDGDWYVVVTDLAGEDAAWAGVS